MATVSDELVYTCPRCEADYVLWSGGMPEISLERRNELSGIIDKQYKLGSCKNCVRRDPNVPTTLEMDQILTEKDIRDRFYLMRQCSVCSEWQKHDRRLGQGTPCKSCQSTNFDLRSYVSIRTFNPKTGKKASKSSGVDLGKASWDNPRLVSDKFKK